MKRYVIRHGHTGVARDKRDTFGSDGPPLDKLGQKQAVELGDLLTKLGIDTRTEPVAVSEYLRTRQTAELAGFTGIQVRPVLNEINTGLPHEELISMLTAMQLPNVVLERARVILGNPLKERVWVTHGLVIMGLSELLGIKTDQFDPLNCGIIEMEI